MCKSTTVLLGAISLQMKRSSISFQMAISCSIRAAQGMPPNQRQGANARFGYAINVAILVATARVLVAAPPR
jgi:hypothetical protein